MAHTPETVKAVRGSFIHERLPLPVAATKHGVSYSSAQAWKKKALEEGDDWDKARSAALMAAGGLGDVTNQIIEAFTLLFQNTITDIQDGDYTALQKTEAISRLSDSYSKMMKSAGNSNPKISKLAIAMEVLSEQANFIKLNYPDDIERFSRILEPFGERICEVFG